MISTPYRLECVEYLEGLIYIYIYIVYIAGFTSSEREVVNRTALDKFSPCLGIPCYAKFYSKHYLIFIY